jgi:hypothetical protein
MARYIQSNIPSPNKIFSFTLGNFVGGLNNRDYDPEENQCTSVMNMSFTNDGVMEKRRGTTWYDTLDLGDEEVTWIDEFKPHKEDNILIRATKTKLYFGGTLIANIDGQFHGTNYESKYFFGDSNKLYAYGKFDTENSEYVKIIGTAVADYVLMEVVSPPEGFTPKPNPHIEGVRNVDYTNRKVWYEPCAYEIADEFKGANVVPEGPRFFALREGRMYVAGSDDNDDTVYITDSGNPYYFPVVLSLQVPPNSDRVSGLAVYNDSIVVGRRLDLHVITGDTNRTDAGLPVYRLKKLNSHTGVSSQRTMVNVHNHLYFLGTDSHVYALRGTDYTLEQMLTVPLTRTVDIHAKPISVQKDDIWTACAIFFNDSYYLSIGDKILVYHYLHQAWTVYNQINARSFYVLFNVLLMGNNKGRTLMPSEDHLDLGKPFRGHWTSKYLTMGEQSSFKMFRDFFIVSRTSSQFVTRVNVLFEVDYVDLADSVDIDTSMAIWGSSHFGDTFITREVNASSDFLIYRRGRGIKITFWNGDYESGRVEKVEDLINVANITDGMLIYVEEEEDYYVHEGSVWKVADDFMINQGMCVLETSGEYEFKWKR